MPKRLAGKVAIVTGASREIGRAIRVILAQETATVVLAARSIRTLQETAELIVYFVTHKRNYENF